MAAVVLSSFAAKAQSEVGTITLQPKVGMNLSTLTGEGTKMKVGLVAGVEGQYQVSPLIGVSAGLLYSMQGCGYDGADNKCKYDYLNIPILANFYVTNGLALKIGVQPGFLMSAKYGSEDIKKGCETFDFSIPLGASYEISDFVIDARYNWGLTKTVKGEGVDGTKNSVIQITVGYKFAL